MNDGPVPGQAATIADIQGRPPSSPGYWISRAQYIYKLILEGEQVFRPVRINQLQFELLLASDAFPDSDQVTLARLIGIDKSSATLAIDALERLNLVARAPQSDRRRFFLVHRAMAGEVLDLEWNARVRANRAFLSVLPDKDRRKLIGGLTRIARIRGSGAPEWDGELRDPRFARKPATRLHALQGTADFLMRRAFQVGRGFVLAAGTIDTMTESQAKALFIICTMGPMSMMALTRAFGAERSTLTKILATFEARKWIVRCKDPADHRRILFKPLEAGFAAVETTRQLFAYVDERFERELTPEGFLELCDLLRRLTERQ